MWLRSCCCHILRLYDTSYVCIHRGRDLRRVAVMIDCIMPLTSNASLMWGLRPGKASHVGYRSQIVWKVALDQTKRLQQQTPLGSVRSS